MTSVTMETSTRKRGPMRSSGIIIQQTPRLSVGPGSITRRSNVSVSGSYGGGGSVALPQGYATRVSQEAVQSVKGVRGKEKKEMNKLNGKLAKRLEETALLEGINKQLAEECERLRKMKGANFDKLRTEYMDEIKEAKKELAEAQAEISPLEAKILTLEEALETEKKHNATALGDIKDLQGELQKLNMLLSDAESETSSLRRTLEHLDREKDALKRDLDEARNNSARYSHDLEAARITQINAENERDCLAETIDFERDAFQIELDELSRLMKDMKSFQPNVEKMWKSQFEQVMTEIQDVFNLKHEELVRDYDKKYQIKVDQLNAMPRDNTDAMMQKTENRTLKSQLGDTKSELSRLNEEIARLKERNEALQEVNRKNCEDCEEEKDDLKEQIKALRAELSEMTDDLETISDTKLSLELEIACYKKLLEGEENKMKGALERRSNMQSQGGEMLSGVIAGGVRSGGGQSSQSSSMMSTVGKVRVTRTSNSAASVGEVDPAGRWVTLTNTSKTKDLDISKWKLRREPVEGSRRKQAPIEYTFGKCIIEVGKDLRIFSKGAEDEYEYQKDENKKLNAIVADSCITWGSGNGVMKLYGADDSVKASCVIEYMA